MAIQEIAMIREATNKDSRSIASIYNHYVSHSAATFEETEVNVSEMAKRVEKVQKEGLPWLVAEDNAEVIGYAYAAKWHQRSAFRHTVEVTIYLSPALVSNGIGTELYTALFAKLLKRRIHAAIGVITLPNAASIAIHERFGMTKVGHLHEVGYKFGNWLDVGYWELQLDEARAHQFISING